MHPKKRSCATLSNRRVLNRRNSFSDQGDALRYSLVGICSQLKRYEHTVANTTKHRDIVTARQDPKSVMFHLEIAVLPVHLIAWFKVHKFWMHTVNFSWFTTALASMNYVKCLPKQRSWAVANGHITFSIEWVGFGQEQENRRQHKR